MFTNHQHNNWGKKNCLHLRGKNVLLGRLTGETYFESGILELTRATFGCDDIHAVLITGPQKQTPSIVAWLSQP